MRQTVIRYSEAFKLQVVEEVEGGRHRTLQEAQAKYGIRGAATVQKWLRKYGRQHLLPKVVRVESMEERDELKVLRRQVRELQKALSQTQVKAVLGEAFLEIACERMGVEVEEFKKKAEATLWSEGEGSGRGKGR